MNPLNVRQRWLILAPLLVATIMAAIFVGEEKTVPETVAPPGNRRIAVQSEAQTPLANPSSSLARTSTRPDKSAAEETNLPETINPFRNKNWYVAPPPPKPTAPPLPFQFLGQLVEEDGTRAFIRHQGRHLIIKAGDVIDGTYTVEEVSQGKIVFRYMPLKELQVLRTNPIERQGLLRNG